MGGGKNKIYFPTRSASLVAAIFYLRNHTTIYSQLVV